MWFRDGASTFAPSTDALFYYIFFVSLFFFVLLMALTAYWGVKYRRRPGVAAPVSPSHNTPLELTWSIIPGLLMAVMFFWGATSYLKKTVSPSDAEVIQVEAKRWAWDFTYPNGAGSLQQERVADKLAPVFALPVDQPVKFVINSVDVIHSFYIPEFRIKRDALPNRYTVAWAEPTRVTHRFNPDTKEAEPLEGEKGFYLFCAEYCGDQHAQMAHRIAVMTEPDYNAWLDAQLDTSSIPLVELGETLSSAKGCKTCHSVDGSQGSGPSWLGIWGEPRLPTGGKSAVENEVGFNYIRESILNPSAYVKSGWPNNMPIYQGQFTSRELLAVATYIQSLSAEHADEAQRLSQRELEERRDPAAPPDAEAIIESGGEIPPGADDDPGGG